MLCAVALIVGAAGIPHLVQAPKPLRLHPPHCRTLIIRIQAKAANASEREREREAKNQSSEGDMATAALLRSLHHSL